MSDVGAAFMDNKRGMMTAMPSLRPAPEKIDFGRTMIAANSLSGNSGMKMSSKGTSTLNEGISAIGGLFGDVIGQRPQAAARAAFTPGIMMKQQPAPPRPFGL